MAAVAVSAAEARRGGGRSFHPHACTGDGEVMALNVGVWGPGQKDWGHFEAVLAGLEGKLGELGGMKGLYAQVFYSEEEF